MHYIHNFSANTFKYDLINRGVYKDTTKLPKLKKIILNFNCKTTELKHLTSSLFALELLTTQKSILTTTKKPNILLKIRKGNPVGCKITLRKNNMFRFFLKMIAEIFPKLKNFQEFTINKKNERNSFSFELKDTFNFEELGEHYYLFNNLTKLNITIITNCNTKDELLFMFKSFQFPIKSKQI